MSALKKTGKILLYVIGGIILLLFIIGLFLDPIAKNLLENQVAKAGEGQYSLALEDLDISILDGSVSLSGVDFETDTVAAPNPPYAFLEAREIVLEDVTWLTYLLENKLIVDKILLDSVDVAVFAESTEKDKQKQKETPPFRIRQLDIYPAIKKQVDRLRMKDLSLNEISITLVNVSTQDTLAVDAGELNVQSDDIVVDADKLITDNRAFYSTDIDVRSRDLYVRQSGEKEMVMNLELFGFTTEEEMLGIALDDLRVFRGSIIEEDTALFVTLQDFKLNKLNMEKLQEENTAHLKLVSLTGLQVVNKGGGATASPAQADTTAAGDQAGMKLAQLSLGEKLPEVMDRLELEELDINKVDYRQGDSVRVENASLHAQDIVVSDQSAFANNRFFHVGSMEGNVELLAASMGDPMEHITMSGFAMDFDNGTGNIGFEELYVMPEEKPEKEMWVKAEVGPFNLIGLDTRELPQGILSIDSIGIADPEVLAHMPSREGTTQSKSQKKGQKAFEAPNLYPAIEGILDQLFIDKVAVVNGDIKVVGLAASEQVVKIPAFYLQLSDILIAEGTAYEGERVLHSRDIALRVEDIQYPMPDGLYTAELELFRLSTLEEFIEAREFLYAHPGRPGEIPQQADTGTVVRVENDLFRIDGIKWQRLIKDQEVFAGLVYVGGLDIYGYVNKNRVEKQPKQKSPPTPMPQKMIKKIEQPFYVDKFKLEEAKMVYEVLAKEADSSGIATITDVDMEMANITNIPSILRNNPEIPIRINGKLMGSGDFYTQIVMQMGTDSNLITVEGQLDTMDITKMNRFTEYISRIGFESGKIYELGWNMKINKELAKGTLEMSYDNLMIEISESNSPESSGILKNAGEFLANKLVLEEDVAPASSEKPEEAEFKEERESEEGFPQYVLQGLISGFVDLMVTIF